MKTLIATIALLSLTALSASADNMTSSLGTQGGMHATDTRNRSIFGAPRTSNIFGGISRSGLGGAYNSGRSRSESSGYVAMTGAQVKAYEKTYYGPAASNYSPVGSSRF